MTETQPPSPSLFARSTEAMRQPLEGLRQFFHNLSVRSKFLMYAGILILLMLSLASFALYQIYTIEKRQIPAQTAVRSVESAVHGMHAYELQFMSEADTLNTELYLKRRSANLDAWQQSYQQFEQSYEQLLALYKGTRIEHDLQAVHVQMTQYRDTFLTLTGTYQQRGFQAFGREGVLHQRAATLQESLQNRPSAELLLTQLRNAQNEFLLRKDASSIQAFDAYAGRLNEQLRTSAERTALEEYTHLFHEVVGLYQTIGLTASEGLRGKLNSTLADITPSIEAIEARVLASTNSHTGAISRSIILATVLLCLVAIAMAVAISSFIVKRLRLLLEASQRVTSGDLDYRIPVYTSDELGKLSVSFNAMTIKLHEGRVTLRQRANALAQSVRRFELVSRAVHEAVYEWDVRSGSFHWGDGIVSVFGYRPKDKAATIDWWAAHVHPDDAQALDLSLNDHMARHSSTWKKIYRFKRANGQYAYCQDSGFIEYRHGEPARVVGSLVDITHQKELERAKDEFISIASHQLRTPLGSIRWNLELLTTKQHSMSREATAYIQEAYKSTIRMLGLVSDLLSVARIEQNRVQDMPEKTDLIQIIMLAVTEMKPIARQRRVRIDTTALQHLSAEITIDPKRFREVVQNLLSNAVKYSRTDGTVTVTTSHTAKDVVISIADTGIGIPSEEQGNLFTKFFRAKNVAVTDTEGSGLGLFVVKSYVEKWGGRIWFASQLNKGTAFHISIPRKPRIQKPKT